jgi:hypothetical protein
VAPTGADGFSAMCITDDSAHLFANAMIGSIGTPTDFAAPAPYQLVATDLGAGTMGAGDVSLAAGAAGSEVVNVVYRSREHGDVAATVDQGRFALWPESCHIGDPLLTSRPWPAGLRLTGGRCGH